MPQAPEDWPEITKMLYEAPGEFGWEIRRGSIQPGKTLSHEAVQNTVDQIHDFIQCQLMKRWDQTNEPPTVARITVTVEVQ